MTRGTGSDLLITTGQADAMHARGVLGGLIDALSGIELAHDAGVAVAARARRDNVRGDRFAAVPVRGIFGAPFVLRRGVPSVAINATESSFAVDVCAKRSDGVRKPGRLERSMTRDATVHRRLTRRVRCAQEDSHTEGAEY